MLDFLDPVRPVESFLCLELTAKRWKLFLGNFETHAETNTDHNNAYSCCFWLNSFAAPEIRYISALKVIKRNLREI